MKVAVLVALSGLALWPPATVHAHGGGLNAEGCHNNRKTGDYHCHRPQASSSSSRQSTAAPSPPREARPQALRSTATAFANCAAARAAGAAPVRRDQPGYGPHLDRDGDGVGYE